MHKIAVIPLALLLIGSFVGTIQSASGATTLSVPEFTLKLVAYPYEIPIYTVNESTGETVTQQGYHMENRSIEVKIKNPPKNNAYPLYYDIQTKDPEYQNWHIPSEPSGYCHYSTQPPYNSYLASSGEYTVISCYANYTVGTKLDFQVKAYYGKTTWDNLQDHPLAIYCNFEVITSSDWSPTQTIIIGEPEYHTETANTPSPQTAQQQITQDQFLLGLDWKDLAIILLIGVIGVFAVCLVLSRKKKTIISPES